MGYIYCLTSPSGKKYIGQTRRSIEKRFEEHASGSSGCRILGNAVKKYGFESFTKEVLLCIDDELLDEHEQKFIVEFNTMYPNGYNIRSGGSNGFHCDESREKMRLSKLGPKNHNFGKPRTSETKANISKAKTGENHHFFGKQLSYEHKLALSRGHKKDDLPMYLVKIKERPHASGGYAVVNHPLLPTKYFTSSKISMNERLEKAYAYLYSIDKDAVQRLDGSRE